MDFPKAGQRWLYCDKENGIEHIAEIIFNDAHNVSYEVIQNIKQGIDPEFGKVDYYVGKINTSRGLRHLVQGTYHRCTYNWHYLPNQDKINEL